MPTLITISVMLAGVSYAEIPVKSFTIDSALKETLASHPSVKSAEERLAEARARRSGVISAALPTLSAAALAQTRQDAFTSQSLLFGGDQYNFYDVGLRLRQPIFQGGAFFGGLRFHGKEVDIQERNLEIARRDLTRQVIDSFYEMLLAQKRVEIIERQLKLQSDLYGSASRRARLGTGRRLEMLQIKTQLALLKPKLAQARSELVTQATSLASLLGIRDQVRLEVKGQLTPPDFASLKAKYETSSYTRPEILQLQQEVDQFSDRRTLDLAKHYPRLEFTAFFGRNATKKTDLLDGDRTSWNFGLELGIPLFSGLSSFQDRKVLAAQEGQLLAKESRSRTDLAVESVQADEDMQVGLAVVESSREALTEATAAYQEARRSYSTGTATYQQYSESQRSMLDAELGNEQAQYDYIQKLSRYFVARGWPLDELVTFLEKRGT